MPLVSVIMPAYNAGPFISQAIESVLLQDFDDWELIVINDGSLDNTPEIVQKFTRKDWRIKLLNRENGKQGRARNEGMKISTGKFLAFLDADDWWAPCKLSQQLDFINQNGADLVFADAFIFKDGKALDAMGSAIGKLQGETAVSSMLIQNRIPILTVLVKRVVLEKVGGFSETLAIQNAEDYHLWLTLLANGFVCCGADIKLAYYRLHEHNATSNQQQAFWPVCYALSDLGKADLPYSKLFKAALILQCNQWLKNAHSLDAQSLKKGLHHLAHFAVGLPSLFIILGLKAKVPPYFWRRTLKLLYARNIHYHSML